MSLALIIGTATLFFTWRRKKSPTERREHFRIACFLGSIYWLAGLTAILYPGTSGLDPEFGGPDFPQKWLFTAGIGLASTGMMLEGGI